MNKYAVAKVVIERGHRFEDRNVGIHGFRLGRLKVRKLPSGAVYLEKSPKLRDFRLDRTPKVFWARVYDPETQTRLRIPGEIYEMCLAAEELVNRRYEDSAIPAEGPTH